MNSSPKYSGKDVAMVIPTKDRPEKVREFLASVAAQNVRPGLIVFVDSGESIEPIISLFTDQLNIKYYVANQKGQIPQRNQGIATLTSDTPLVAFFDDDIVLEAGAIRAMISYLNELPENTAGVGFNIINMEGLKSNFLLEILGITCTKPGHVLRSGANTPITSIDKNIESHWLCGGATVWKLEIVNQFNHREFSTRWASCEDLIFSYPIGKKYPLFVCADAKVRHEHVYDHTGNQKFYFYGKTETLWRLYFVMSNPELSIFSFLKMILALSVARFILGVAKFRTKHFQFALGQIKGLYLGFLVIFKFKSWTDVLGEA
ncbi:MAG: glycosyltransferase family 2 protein [Bdellovibrionales bacterium]|nr:glycosyltransferase family 2 protein [Bdellovibrionales bacterium]